MKDIDLERNDLHEPDPPSPIYECEGCTNKIHEGDAYYNITNEILCDDCFAAMYRRFAITPEPFDPDPFDAELFDSPLYHPELDGPDQYDPE